ncbi:MULTISPECIES: HAD hydrolase family protein [unclassified Brenneria]|uniref:HAD hydrolase family protein n=1 Tax=unclassified Brenneria TaxID=2634434 RepID=UPI0018F06679|nr:HAD hydrolase family protein [Brenneria sp. L3-3C-1]MBJ7221434.1 HAD hydrolase family protein [Brenneria sp. L3-3C-1]MEE3642677.1 HAD hydrolase family protein [Brenneria sp. L3_3C_1]
MNCIIKPKCFVFDLDGTIIFNNKTLSESLENEIIKLSEYGMVIFATARPFRDVKQVLPSTLWSSHIVCMNGSVYYKNQSTEDVKYIDHNITKDIIYFLLSSNIPFVADNDECFYLTNHDLDFFKYTKSCGIKPVSDIEHMLKKGICKIQIFGKNHIHNFVNLEETIIHNYRDVDFFDLSSKRVDKADLILKYNLRNYKVIAFGNDTNDFKILKSADLSVCIGDNIKLKDVCDYVIDSFDTERDIVSFIQAELYEI